VKFSQKTLPNGLTVLGEYRPEAVSVALGFFVKTGARDEVGPESGVTHFLEHMMFKGTKKRNALQLTYDLASIGAQANAYTTEETTVYYAALLPEYLSQGTEILSDMLRPTLDEAEFTTEKKVILEEIALYQDRPTHVLFENALKGYFGTHAAGNSVLGTSESISDLRRDQMQAYFDRRYSAANIVAVASGNFDWEEYVSLLEKYCQHWPSDTAYREVLPHTGEHGEKELRREGLQMGHVCLLGPAPSATDNERFAASVLATVLGDYSGSRAYWELIDKGLADSASIDVDEMDGTGVLYAYASGAPEMLPQVEGILRHILNSPLDFDEEALERAKTKIASRIVLSGESSMRRCMAVGDNWIYREEYRALKDDLEALQNVSRASIEAMLERFSFTPSYRVALLPQEHVKS